LNALSLNSNIDRQSRLETDLACGRAPGKIQGGSLMNMRAMRRFILSAFITIACAALASAQDAGQVLRVTVGYNTLKNSVEMSAEKRAKVNQLGEMAKAAGSAAKYGEALKHLYHAMALMRGTEWTPARALASALNLRVDRAMLEPSQSVAVRLKQIYSLDERLEGKLTGSIALLKMTGDEPVKVLKTIDAINPDFISSQFAPEITVPDVEAGNYRIALTLKQAAGDSITKTATVHIERGLAAQVIRAASRATDLAERLKAKGEDALAAALPSAQYRISLFDRANASEISFERINFGEELKEASAMLSALEAGRDPFATRRGDFKKAYRSKVDNTLQPYRIFAPASYDGSKPLPLIIALHGMGGNENSYFDSYANGAFKAEAETRGYIVACPKGREPASMYLGSAEKDVMDVIAEVRRDYRIDTDRIYMTGHSMGGFGSWSIAMNHPEVFAAIAPVAGGGNPLTLAKIAHVPQLVVHGDNDKTVPVERSRVMVGAAKKSGAQVKYIEVPGGSHIDVVVPTFKVVFDWFDAHRRAKAEAKAGAAGAKTN
jgi:predicted esterase